MDNNTKKILSLLIVGITVISIVYIIYVVKKKNKYKIVKMN